nr:IS110 family transposase [Snodgrassella sp. CFCC 13594]
MTAYLGIDVSKQTIDCYLSCDKGTFQTKQSNNGKGFQQLQNWIDSHCDDQLCICMEATGAYWQKLANCLYANGHQVCVENPAKIKYFSKAVMVRNKTDKQDAMVIANYCRMMNPRIWRPESDNVLALRNIMRLLARLKRQRASELTKVIETQESLRHIIHANITHFDKQIAETEKYLKQFFKQNSDLNQQKALIKTIPGVGDTTAAVMLSVLLGSQQFEHAGQFVAYLGLNPQQHQSGTSVNGKTRISKIGKADLRTALYMPAMVAYSKRLYPQFVDRMKARGKPTMVIITALMRKLAVLAYTIHKKQTPYVKAH